MPAALYSMKQSSYVYTHFENFVKAASHAVIHPEDFPPKNNMQYLENYVFAENGDESLADILAKDKTSS